MTRHAFGLGCIGFDFIDHAFGTDGGGHLFGGASAARAPALEDLWFAVFNQATLPFYWRGFEPEPGRPDTARMAAAARWFRERGARVKGHPLLWHTLAPAWLRGLSDDDLVATIRARILREAGDFAGLVDQWDAINETVILPVFTAEDNAVTRLAQRRGRLEVVRLAFESARAADPAARLVINDFDLSEAYERVIEEYLDAGLPVDAIGLQTHMHQGFRGEDQLAHILDRFARFGLPLQLTETTLVSGDLMPPEIVDLNDYQPAHWPSTPEGEDRQAREIVRHYTVAWEHPAVESVTYWGLTDEGAWLGAPAGLVHADATPKPAYEALRTLVREHWWTPPVIETADAEGWVTLSGTAGTYAVSVPGREEIAVEVTASPAAPLAWAPHHVRT